MNKLIYVFFPLIFLISNSSSAESLYYGFGYTSTKFSQIASDESAQFNAVHGKFGFALTKNFSFESIVGVGLNESEINPVGVETKIGLKSFYGISLKAGFPLFKNIYPHLSIGRMRGYMNTEVLGLKLPLKASDTSYGVGIDYRFRRSAISLQYNHFFDKDYAQLKGLSITFIKAF